MPVLKIAKLWSKNQDVTFNEEEFGDTADAVILMCKMVYRQQREWHGVDSWLKGMRWVVIKG